MSTMYPNEPLDSKLDPVTGEAKKVLDPHQELDSKEYFPDIARRLVKTYVNGERTARQIEMGESVVKMEDVFIVWFCKTLQNWKALVSTTQPDLRYYEVTYNGNKGETYLDVYQKVDNLRISDSVRDL